MGFIIEPDVRVNDVQASSNTKNESIRIVEGMLGCMCSLLSFVVFKYEYIKE